MGFCLLIIILSIMEFFMKSSRNSFVIDGGFFWCFDQGVNGGATLACWFGFMALMLDNRFCIVVCAKKCAMGPAS